MRDKAVTAQTASPSSAQAASPSSVQAASPSSVQIALAPMAGMTDSAFRTVCSRFGADYTVSEMISSVAMCYGDKKTASFSLIGENEAPTALQIFGHDPDIMAKAAETLLSGDFEGCSYARAPFAIDINMGCPVRKIVSGGDGSALMRSPGLCYEITAAVSGACRKYGALLSVKLRSGWDGEHVNAPEIARLCAEAGADIITVHARTRDMMYSGQPDRGVIRKVRESVPDNVRVIANGDVKCYEQWQSMMDDTLCDGVMIGRAALSDPWVFAEIKARSSGKTYTPPLPEERSALAALLIKESVMRYGERCGVVTSRARSSYLIRNLPGAAAIRARLNCALTLKDALAALGQDM